MQLDDLLKVTFDGEGWIQIQVCTLPNGRRHRHDENRKQKLARYFRTGTSKTCSSGFRSWPEARNSWFSIRDPVLARDKEFQGLWFLLLSPSDFFLLCFHRTLNDQHYLEAVHVGVAKTERYLDILDGPPGLTY